LQIGDAQSDAILADLAHLANGAETSLELRVVGGGAEGTGHLGFAPVQRLPADAADCEWIKLLVLQLMLIHGVHLAGLQDLPHLLGDIC